MMQVEELPVPRSYEHWTETGVYCEKSGQNCGQCDVSPYGVYQANPKKQIHPVHRCRQPEVNAVLKAKGIPMPQKINLGRALCQDCGMIIHDHGHKYCPKRGAKHG